jgi:hypothetical protein
MMRVIKHIFARIGGCTHFLNAAQFLMGAGVYNVFTTILP